MSAQQLANRCEELGLPIGRSVLANFESGRRPAISVPELLVLARALGVSPVALVAPIDHDDTVEILPGQDVPAYDAMVWLSGERRFPGEAGPRDEPADPAMTSAYREHAHYVAEWFKVNRRAADALAGADDDQSAADRIAAAHDLVDRAERDVINVRRELRRAGVRLPELPAGLQHIDTDEGEGE